MDNARFQSEFVEGVEGWLERVTSMRSMDILDFQEANGYSGGLVEIGVYHGKYFMVLARSAQRTGERLIGIDTFQWKSEEDVRRALAMSGETAEAKVQLIRCYSHQCTPSGLLERLGGLARFISVDGSHDAPDVLLDLELSEQILSPEGVVAVDDFINPVAIGVNEGVHQFFSRPRRMTPFAYINNKLFLAHRGIASVYRDFIEGVIVQDRVEPASKTFRERNASSRHLVEQRLWGHSVIMCPY
ncbi:class I SAM-dependent methyltransferase [Pseudoxanthomonas japonensis]|uniref:class I SAM-dependent methyltransferase n=1 Tax=Pseudoxanthomonas japonensis TaxID=69284 RepID=UPI001BD14831|nr:class I SAM-dependent methyltransferase [Pseudoxanthomonas japonensis]